MNIIRWVLASVLGIVFLVIATTGVLAMRINQTVLSPDFYVKELRQADAFNFFYDKVLPSMLDDFEQELDQDGRGTLAPAKLEAASSLRQIFPPAWLQTHSEASIHAVVPYLIGKNDTFKVEVPLHAPVEAAGAAVKRLAGDDAILDMLFDQLVAERLREVLSGDDGSGELPLNAAAIEPLIREVLDNAWIASQVNASVDTLLPYLITDREDFQVKLDLTTRQPGFRKALGGLLDSWDSSAFLVANAIDPLVASAVPAEGYQVGFGLSARREDVRAALTSDSSRGWLNTQGHGVATAVLDYVMNDSSALTITVRLDDIKAQVAMTIARDLDIRLGTHYASARVCTPVELAAYDPSQAARSGFGCRPTVSYAQAKAAAGITDFPAQAASVISGYLPSIITLDQATLQLALGPQQWALVTDARTVFKQKFTFTDRDLKEQLTKNSYQAVGGIPFEDLRGTQREQAIATSSSVHSLGKFRNFLSTGVVFSEKDLRERMDSSGEDGGAGLDKARDTLSKARRYSLLFWLLPLLLIVGVGFIGGRSRPGKVLWAAAFILALSAILIATGTGYKNAAQPRIMEGLQQAISADSVGDPIWMGLMLDKASEVAVQAADDFAGDIVVWGYALLILSSITIGASALLLRRARQPRGA